MGNVYYDDNLGLTRLDMLEEAGLSYEFHMLGVFQDNKTGRVFYAECAGCSCPSPFEDYHFNSADDTNMDEVTQFNFGRFESAVNNFPVSMEERQSCLVKVHAAIKEQYKDTI